MVRMRLALSTGAIIPWQQTMGSPMKQNDMRLQAEIDLLLAHGPNHKVSRKHILDRGDRYA